jgi:hypothetical protein
VGKLLVTWGTRQADAEGVYCSVITGESKREFYGKSGFTGDDWTASGEGLILFRKPVIR